MINILIVWLVSGLWHGANWTFIVWGLFHGVLIILSGFPKQIKKRKGLSQKDSNRNALLNILSIVGTFILVNISWIFFRSSSIGEAARFIWHTVKIWTPSAYSVFSDSSISKINWLFVCSIVFVAALILLKVLLNNSEHLFPNLKFRKTVVATGKYATTIVFFAISIFVFIYLNSLGGGESSFIYFDF